MNQFQRIRIRLRVFYLQAIIFIKSMVYKFKYRKKIQPAKNNAPSLPPKKMINLDKYIKKGCNKCFERAFSGYDIKTKMPILCECIIKNSRTAIERKELIVDDTVFLYSEKIEKEKRLIRQQNFEEKKA